MSERFYINLPLAPGPVELDGPEAHHLARVCRLRAGAEICLFNGDGRQYPARVLDASRRTVALEVTSVELVERELSFRLEIAAPLPRGDRAQFLVEKLTEVGVASFVPLLCQRGVVEPGSGKLEKLRRHVIEASKQCGRNVLMEIAEATDWESYCRRGEAGEIRLVAHPRTTGPRPFATGNKSMRCAVGPEGGLTDEEIKMATESGWQLVDLGSRILRVETAALALAILAADERKPTDSAPSSA